MEWLLKILLAHKRMRGLSEAQLQELIQRADDIESLRMIKQHLEAGSFRFRHIEAGAPAMIQQCIDKAKELLWQQHAGEIKTHFFEKIGDPFAFVIDKIHWFV